MGLGAQLLGGGHGHDDGGGDHRPWLHYLRADKPSRDGS